MKRDKRKRKREEYIIIKEECCKEKGTIKSCKIKNRQRERGKKTE